MRTVILLSAAILAAAVSPASAAIISFNAPTVANGPFDIVVQASSLFAGRDAATDSVISYGFNVTVSNPAILTFTGATSGSLFDTATTEPGTNVFGAASGLGIFPPASGTITLATLHFKTTGSGSANVLISTDLSNSFQGLQFLNAPFAQSISGTVAVSAIPEPATLGLVGIMLAGLVIARRHTLRCN